MDCDGRRLLWLTHKELDKEIDYFICDDFSIRFHLREKVADENVCEIMREECVSGLFVNLMKNIV